jgi:integrase
MNPRQRWLSHFEDEKAKRRNSRALDRFEKSAGVGAEVLLRRTRAQIRSDYPEDAEDAFQEFYNDMRSRGLNHDSANQWIFVIRGFFRANGVRLPRLLLVKSDGPPGPHGLPFNQLDVRRMIRRLANAPKQSPLITRRNKAVIAFLAQTGQKESVLAGIAWEMVYWGNETARRHGYPSHALVEIDPEFPKNQLGRRYRFVIGSDTMRLMERLPRPHAGKVFKTTKGKGKMSVRTIGRIVDEAAEKCGLQREKERRYRGWKSHAVTPEVFRKYWKFQMRSGGVEDRDLLNYMMGLRKSASDEWPDGHLLGKYKKAERKLAVLPLSSR